jgi:hypothetical protein
LVQGRDTRKRFGVTREPMCVARHDALHRRDTAP